MSKVGNILLYGGILASAVGLTGNVISNDSGSDVMIGITNGEYSPENRNYQERTKSGRSPWFYLACAGGLAAGVGLGIKSTTQRDRRSSGLEEESSR